jgi:hypothetical protein
MEVSTGGGVQGSAIQLLLEILGKAAEHHDTANPVTHDLDALSAQAASIPMPANALGQILALLIQSAPAVIALIEALKPHAKPTEMPTAPPMVPVPAPPTAGAPGVPATPAGPKVFTEPTPPAGSAVLDLEVQIEEGWADWKADRTIDPNTGKEVNGDGHFDPAADIRAGMALPPESVVRFMSGDGKFYNRGEKRGYPQAWALSADDGASVSFSSDADGSSQPAPNLIHVQFGPHWDESDGRDVTIRFMPYHGSGPRVWSVQTVVGTQKSNVITVPISHSKN